MSSTVPGAGLGDVGWGLGGMDGRWRGQYILTSGYPAQRHLTRPAGPTFPSSPTPVPHPGGAAAHVPPLHPLC